MAVDFGKRMQEARGVTGITQAQVALAAGRGSKAVSEWERDEKRPPWSVINRLCAALKWPTKIFEEGGPRPAEVLRATTGVAEETVPPYPGVDSQLPERDLFWLVVNDPEAFVAKMERAGEQMGTAALLAFLEDAEKIVRERHGADMAKFFRALRDRVKEREKR